MPLGNLKSMKSWLSEKQHKRVALIMALAIITFNIQVAVASTQGHQNDVKSTVSGAVTVSSKVVIKGNAVVGETLSVSVDKSITGSVRFQWSRNQTQIRGATKSTYKLTSTDVGKRITVEITTTRGAVYLSKSVLILDTFKTIPAPTISGESRVGSTLVASAGVWVPSPDKVKFQWFAAGSPIAGADKSSFQVTMSQLGKSLKVTVTGEKSGFDSDSNSARVPGVPLGPSQLATNQVLNQGQYLNSPNGQFKLIMQADGNCVEYDSAGKVLWSLNASGSNRLIMQDDGNLVFRRSDGSAIWDSKTYQSGANNYAVIQDDGNFVVKLSNGTPQWTRFVSLSGVVLPTGGTQQMSDASLTSTQYGTYAYNRTLWVVCYKYGQNVQGVGGWSNLWHQVVDGSFIGDSDFKTGVNGPMAGEPACAGTGAPGVNGWAYPILPHATLTTYAGHGGDDFPVGVGTPVYSMGAGPVSLNTYAVTSSWCPVSSALGGQQTDLQVTTVRDGYTYVVTYAHLNSFAVSSGQVVQAGQLIGYSGSKGCATGPHLHVDMKRNGVSNVIFPRNIFGTSY